MEKVARVMKHGFMATIHKLSNNLHKGRVLHLHAQKKPDKFDQMWSQWFFFFTLRELCIGNSYHRGKQWIKCFTNKFCEDWGRVCDANGRRNGGLVTGSCITTTRQRTKPFLDKNRMDTVPYPPYSPELAPADCFLFLRLNRRLQGHRFEDINVIQRESQKVLDTFKEDYFQRCFQQWQERWNKCINSQGDYFEGDSAV